MATESLTIDPAAVSTNTPLLLQDPANGLTVIDADFTPPDRNVLYATSIDTEGGDAVARQYQNRTITATVRCFDVAANDGKMAAGIKKLQQKVGLLQREGGYLGRVDSGSGGTIFFTVEDANVEVPSDNIYAIRKNALCKVSFTCRPLGFGAEVTLSDHVETALPVLTFTEASVAGDVPALGRLVVDNDQAGQDQLWLQWGVRSKNYSSAAGGSLFYEAETRLPLSLGVLAARSGASGGTVIRGTLSTSYQPVMSFASSGTAYPSHVGNYQVMARVYDPGGTAGATSGGTVGNVLLALEWAQGDFLQTTRNDAVSPIAINDFTVVDFGQVQLTAATTGTQRWDGRIIAKSVNVGDIVDVDCVWFVPVDEGSGEVTAAGAAVLQAPVTFSARDEFNQTAGTLGAKVLPVGGTWVTSGYATDYSLDTSGHTVQRTTISDTGALARFGVAGTTAPSLVAAQVDVKSNATGASGQLQLGVLARYVDGSNFLAAYLAPGTTSQAVLNVVVMVGSSSSFATGGGNYQATVPFALNAFYTVRMVVLANGYFAVAVGPAGFPLTTWVTARHAALATGGTLATGKYGLYDTNGNATAATRTYDNFNAWVPTLDAAVYALQSLELRSDRIRREDTSGTVWGAPYLYEGDYLTIPPSGQEGRTSQFIVKMSRGVQGVMPDSGIDDLSAQLFVTPRYLNVPET